jgi:hypothetical protein
MIRRWYIHELILSRVATSRRVVKVVSTWRYAFVTVETTKLRRNADHRTVRDDNRARYRISRPQYPECHENQQRPAFTVRATNSQRYARRTIMSDSSYRIARHQDQIGVEPWYQSTRRINEKFHRFKAIAGATMTMPSLACRQPARSGFSFSF